MERPLAYYAIKDHSEVTVVVKPMLSLQQARVLARSDGVVTRLRIMSHKLGAPIPLEELTPDHNGNGSGGYPAGGWPRA